MHSQASNEARVANIRKNTKVSKIASDEGEELGFPETRRYDESAEVEITALDNKGELFTTSTGDNFKNKRSVKEKHNIVDIFPSPLAAVALTDENKILSYPNFSVEIGYSRILREMIAKIYGGSLPIKDVQIRDGRMFVVLEDKSAIILNSSAKSSIYQNQLIKGAEVIQGDGAVHVSSELLKSSDGKLPKKIKWYCSELIFAMYENSSEVVTIDLLGEKKYFPMSSQVVDIMNSPRGVVILTEDGESVFMMSVLNKNIVRIANDPIPTGIEPSRNLSFCQNGFVSISRQGILKIWSGHSHPAHLKLVDEDEMTSEFMVHDRPLQLLAKNWGRISVKAYALMDNGKIYIFDEKPRRPRPRRDVIFVGSSV